MKGSLPDDVVEVFERSVTTEFVTVDGRGQPIAWPVTPYCHTDEGCIDVTTGLGDPKKADDATRNPTVALLFSDPTGSGMSAPPIVLVQGTAQVDDRDLEANRERYERESAIKLPGAQKGQPPTALRRFFDWYYTPIYIHVRPERVYVWRDRNLEAEPELYDAHLDEVRTAHNQEPESGHAPPEGGPPDWDPRLDELGTHYGTAALGFVGPEGFPFAVRVPVRADRAAGVVRIEADPEGAPIEPGLACLCAHDHAPDFSWRRNFQVGGDLEEDHGGWLLRPHKLVGGVEPSPTSTVQRYRHNARKALRFRRIAKGELAKRGR